jgi:hypothetical protein
VSGKGKLDNSFNCLVELKVRENKDFFFYQMRENKDTYYLNGINVSI